MRTYHTFDLVIIGAGSAGLTALKEARRHSGNVLMIHDGPTGTTCTRSGCMPSKSLIHAAQLFHSRRHMARAGITGADALQADIPAVLREVRRQRDHFVAHMQEETERWSDCIIRGKARLESPGKIRVGQRLIHAANILIATGSTPHIPPAYQPFSDRLLTTDTLFEQEDLPARIAVAGTGAIGLEMAQALARLGIDVTLIGRSDRLAGFAKGPMHQQILAMLERDMRVWLNTEPDIRRTQNGLRLTRKQGESAEVEAILVATGRRAETGLLRGSGLELPEDEHGRLMVNHYSMQLHDAQPVYLAGDVTAGRAVLHEAVDEGRRAVQHIFTPETAFRPRYPKLQIIFTHPQIAIIADTPPQLREAHLLSVTQSFATQGRATLEQVNEGSLTLWADRQNGQLRGAELLAPSGEHLAHYLAAAITQKLTPAQMLQAPFYHPTIEEGLQSALKKLASALKKADTPAAS
jgi:dihydrolipoamide dehydrogenase